MPNKKMKTKLELQSKYDNWVKINSEDGYSRVIVDVTEVLAKLLDEGKTPEETLAGLRGHDLTGYMAGVAVSAIVHFHPRGEEVKKPWNKQCGNEDAKGTINPAIITIETKR